MSGTHKISPGKGHFFPPRQRSLLGGQAAGYAIVCENTACLQPVSIPRGSAIGQRKKAPLPGEAGQGRSFRAQYAQAVPDFSDGISTSRPAG